MRCGFRAATNNCRRLREKMTTTTVTGKKVVCGSTKESFSCVIWCSFGIVACHRYCMYRVALWRFWERWWVIFPHHFLNWGGNADVYTFTAVVCCFLLCISMKEESTFEMHIKLAIKSEKAPGMEWHSNYKFKPWNIVFVVSRTKWQHRFCYDQQIQFRTPFKE